MAVESIHQGKELVTLRYLFSVVAALLFVTAAYGDTSADQPDCVDDCIWRGVYNRGGYTN